MDGLMFIKRDLRHFVDGLKIPEAIEGESKQPPLHIQAHQARRHVDTQQAGVNLLAPEQCPEVHRVVGDKHVAARDRAAHD